MPPVATTIAAHVRNSADSASNTLRTGEIVLQFRPSVDAHSHIAADAINEGGTVVSSMVSIQDVLDPTDINIYRDLAGGLTTANVLHGSANPIGGGNAVIKLRWGKKRGEELLFEGAMPGIKFALGENPKDMRQFGQTGPRRYPVTRAGTEFVIRDAFTRAKAYRQAWQDYERA